MCIKRLVTGTQLMEYHYPDKESLILCGASNATVITGAGDRCSCCQRAGEEEKSSFVKGFIFYFSIRYKSVRIARN